MKEFSNLNRIRQGKALIEGTEPQKASYIYKVIAIPGSTFEARRARESDSLSGTIF